MFFSVAAGAIETGTQISTAYLTLCITQTNWNTGLARVASDASQSTWADGELNAQAFCF